VKLSLGSAQPREVVVGNEFSIRAFSNSCFREARVLEVVERFLLRDPIEGFTKRVFEGGDRSEFTTTQFILDLREDLLDWVEVGTVWRQMEHLCITRL